MGVGKFFYIKKVYEKRLLLYKCIKLKFTDLSYLAEVWLSHFNSTLFIEPQSKRSV